MTTYLITGGTGLIGRALITQLLSSGTRIVVLTRDRQKAKNIWGDKAELVESLTEISADTPIDHLVNLAGEPIADKRWSAKQKQRLWQSRIELTDKLVAWIKTRAHPPKILISGSAVGWYGNGSSLLLTESSPAHLEYTHTLCEAWERAALAAKQYGVNVCTIRTGIVISPSGGFLGKLLLPFSLGLGARLGDGQQYLSWVHIDDVVAAILFLIQQAVENPMSSPSVVNLTSPTPVNNLDFSVTLAKQLKRPLWLFIPSGLLRLVLGEMSRLLLTGQRVAPEKLLALGFRFKYSTLEHALAAVLAEHYPSN